MGIEFDKTKIKGSFPVFWHGECAVLPGDFKLTTELAEGTIVRKGTPIKLDFDSMECKICKAVKVLAGGTTTKPRIGKDSFVAKGDSIGGQNVSSVDSSNSDYDVVTLAAAVESATEGAILAVGTDEPDAVVETTFVYTKNMSFQTVSAGYEVLILKDVAYPVPSSWLTGFSMKNNPTIKYIRQ
jgi:hypothetical protein